MMTKDARATKPYEVCWVEFGHKEQLQSFHKTPALAVAKMDRVCRKPGTTAELIVNGRIVMVYLTGGVMDLLEPGPWCPSR